MMRSALPHPPYTLTQLEDDFPWVSWRKPVKIFAEGLGVEHYACRICIANYGLMHDAVSDLPLTEEQVRTHIEDEHL